MVIGTLSFYSSPSLSRLGLVFTSVIGLEYLYNVMLGFRLGLESVLALVGGGSVEFLVSDV